VPIFGAQSKIVRAVLGSWTLSGIGIVTTGAPVTPTAADC